MQVQLIKITASSAFVAQCINTNTILQFSVSTQGSLNRERLREGQTLAFADAKFVPRTNFVHGSITDGYLYKRKRIRLV